MRDAPAFSNLVSVLCLLQHQGFNSPCVTLHSAISSKNTDRPDLSRGGVHSRFCTRKEAQNNVVFMFTVCKGEVDTMCESLPVSALGSRECRG